MMPIFNNIQQGTTWCIEKKVPPFIETDVKTSILIHAAQIISLLYNIVYH